jgi:spoIIIJ-associated protein
MQVTPEEREVVRELATELAQKLGFDTEVTISEDPLEEGSLRVAFSVKEGQHFLIGQRGANLSALQHLFRSLYRKRSQAVTGVTLDINDYIKEKEVLLFRDVDKAVAEMLSQNASVALRPMFSFERKMVHRYLSGHPKVRTESVGTGEQRKIFIRPKISSDDVPGTEE